MSDARFEPNGFMWKAKRVSDLTVEELQQALCRTISDLYGIVDARNEFRKTYPILAGMSEPLNAPNQFHGPSGEACEYISSLK